jgi:hypothetical protein
MVEFPINNCAGAQSGISQLHRARTAARACSPAHLSRQIAESWHFISLNDPPSWLRNICILVVVVYMIALLFDAVPKLGPWRLNHSDSVFLGMFFGWIIVWLATLLVVWAITNAVLAIVRLATFPFVLSLMLLRRFTAGLRLLPRFLDVLVPMMPACDAIDLFVLVLTKASAEQVQTLEAVTSGKIVSKLVEYYKTEVLAMVSAWAWPQLVTADLSPTAMAILCGHSLNYDAGGKLVLAALTAGNFFVAPGYDQLLAQQLAALPVNGLAGVLDAIAALDRSLPHHSLPHILKCVQLLGEISSLRRFQEALSLVSLQTCEAALLHAESLQLCRVLATTR